MTIDDYDELVSLWKRGGLSYRPKGRDARDRMERELEGEGAVFLAAEIDGQLVGAVLGTHDGRKGWINRLIVSPEHRRKGIARALVEAVDQKLVDRGIDILTCLVEDWNQESAAFFKRLGFAGFDDITYYSRRRYDEV